MNGIKLTVRQEGYDKEQVQNLIKEIVSENNLLAEQKEIMENNLNILTAKYQSLLEEKNNLAIKAQQILDDANRNAKIIIENAFLQAENMSGILEIEQRPKNESHIAIIKELVNQ